MKNVSSHFLSIAPHLLSALLVGAVSGGVLNAQARTPITGTYRIAVCKVAPCTPTAADSVRHVVWGTLVIGDTALPVAALGRRNLALRLTEPVNVCWVTSTRHRHATTYAGVGGLGATTWIPVATDSSRIDLYLYRGPDAFHRMTGVAGNGVIRAAGNSSGIGTTQTSWPRDTIVAQRIGPPDYSPCVEAAQLPVQTPTSGLKLSLRLDRLPVVGDSADERFAIVLRPGISIDLQSQPLPWAQTRANELRDPGTAVYLPERASGISGEAFTVSVLSAIRDLLARGVAADRIALVGAEDGALIAATIATQLEAPIGYVFVGGCPAALRAVAEGKLRGKILSIVATSAVETTSCQSTFAESPQLSVHAEQRLDAIMMQGRGGPSLPLYHARPPGVWVDFASDWILRRRVGPPWALGKGSLPIERAAALRYAPG